LWAITNANHPGKKGKNYKDQIQTLQNQKDRLLKSFYDEETTDLMTQDEQADNPTDAARIAWEIYQRSKGG